MDEDNPCVECGGACCSFRNIRISWISLDDGEIFEDAKDDLDVSRLPFEDGEVPDMEWYLEDQPGGRIFFECNHLEDGLCSEYERRPEMCRAFECMVLKGEETLSEFKQATQWEPGELEKLDLREITDEMKELIAEKTEAEVVA